MVKARGDLKVKGLELVLAIVLVAALGPLPTTVAVAALWAVVHLVRD